jgi:predicted Zn-dependent protease
MKSVLREPSYVDDAEVADYLNSSRQPPGCCELKSHHAIVSIFFAIRDNTVNAICDVWRFHRVNTGTLLTAQSESELAGVTCT